MFINLMPHPATLRPASGDDVIVAPSGIIARVASTPGGVIGDAAGIPVYGAPTYGEVTGLPEPVEGTVYIVSGLVAAAVKAAGGRADVVSPGTGPQDGAVRDEKGQIVAVTRLNAAV
jgi:hypothetical protein